MCLSHGQLKRHRPNLAILPWGATEAHNQHLPYGTDAMQATLFAERSAQLAAELGAKVIVLPTIPFGNNAQQLDQVATIHLHTTTAAAILNDVADSLKAQGITRLLILNSHGGNEFKPLIRDVMQRTGLFVAVANFWQVCPDQIAGLFGDPGDHAGILETSLMMYWHPERVHMETAGKGTRKPFAVPSLGSKGVWTPRPWSQIHADLGSGNPKGATAEKGQAAFELISAAIGRLIADISRAKRLP